MIKVMIADDEENVCRLIQNLVDWDSFDMEIAEVARNGIEALEKIPAVQPDLLITDIRMPGCDGLELIQKAQNLRPELDFIIISGYRHFEYAQNAIKYGVADYLLKPIKKDELTAALQKMRAKHLERADRLGEEERLRTRLKNDIDRLHGSFFTECLLSGGSASGKELSLDFVNGTYHYAFQPGLFAALEVKVDCGYEEQYDSAIPILGEKAEQLLELSLKKSCYDSGIFRSDNTIGCILNFSPEDRKSMHKLVRAVMDELLVQKTMFSQMEFTIGEGMTVGDIGHLRESLQAAEFAAGQRLVAGTGSVIACDRLPAPKTGTGLVSEITRRLSAALELLDEEAVSGCISWLKDTSADRELPGTEILAAARQFCSLYVLELQKLGITLPGGEDLPEKFRIHAGRCGSADLLFQYLGKLVGESLRAVREEKRQQDSKPIRLAKQYIQEHYMQPVSLDDVSSYVGFSAAYFSTLFKRESGENFLDYLTEIRMGKAKDLLKETNLSVAAICEQVGYSDLKHFTRSFRNSTGLKPNEYRKIYS